MSFKTPKKIENFSGSEEIMAASISEPEDKILDIALRPKNWQEYIGQERIKNGLKILLEAAKLRQEPVDHLLFYGPAGLGKTTLAYIIAKEMSASLKITSGPAIEKIGDLASILTNLSPGDVLFIDEVHRLNRTIGEVLYPAMETRPLDGKNHPIGTSSFFFNRRHNQNRSSFGAIKVALRRHVPPGFLRKSRH